MLLPTSIYERVPQFWLLLGLLFMSSGAYVGFEYSVSFLYFGVGLFSCVWSLYVYVLRSRNPQNSQPEPSPQDAQSEQTTPSVHQSTEQTSQGS